MSFLKLNPRFPRPKYFWTASLDGFPQVIVGEDWEDAKVFTETGSPEHIFINEYGVKGWQYDYTTGSSEQSHSSEGAVQMGIGSGNYCLVCYSRFQGNGSGSGVIFTASNELTGATTNIYHRTNGTDGWGTYLNVWVDTGNALSSDTDYLLAIDRRGSTVRFFEDGQDTGFTHTSSIFIVDGRNAKFGSSAYSNNHADGVFYWSAVYDRTLSAAEHAILYELRNNPYARVDALSIIAAQEAPAPGGGHPTIKRFGATPGSGINSGRGRSMF